MIPQPEAKRHELGEKFDDIARKLDAGDFKQACSDMRPLAELILTWIYPLYVGPNAPLALKDLINGLKPKGKSKASETAEPVSEAFEPPEVEYLFEIVRVVSNPYHHANHTVVVESAGRAFHALSDIKTWFGKRYLGGIAPPAFPSLSRLEQDLFVGRDDRIQALHRLLEEKVSPVVIHGATGIGKTELVRQYANRYRLEYSAGVFEFDARSGSAIEEELRKIYRGRGNQQEVERSLEGKISPQEKVQAYWEHWGSGRSLIIFDNVPPRGNLAAEIFRCIPNRPLAYQRFDVLVTSQAALGTHKTGNFPLEELSEDESLSLFEAFLTHKDVLSEEGAARKVCAWLDGLPIALELVARHMLEHETETFAEVLQRFESNGVADDVLDDAFGISAPRGWRESFRMVWDDSLEADSKRLLHLYACFPEGPVPEGLIQRTLTDTGLELSDAKSELVKWHLLKRSGVEPALQMHDLVRRAVRLITRLEVRSSGLNAFARVDTATANDAAPLRRSLASLLEAEAQKFLASKDPVRLENWQDFAESWSEAVDSQGLIASPVEAVTVLNAAFVYWKDMGAYRDILRATRRKELSLEYLQQYVPDTALAIKEEALDSLIDALTGTSDYQGSREVIEQLMTNGDVDDRKKARLLLKLADTDRLEGHYRAAEQHYREAETMVEALAEMTGDDRTLQANARYGIARIARLTGRHDAALHAYKEAKDLFEAIPNVDSSTVAHAESGLGEIHRLMWQLDASREHYTNALKCRSLKRMLVAEWGLGEWERLEGDLNHAMKHYVKSRQLSERAGDVRGISWSLMGIGAVELAYGRFQEALSHFEEADRKATEVVERAHLQLCSAVAKRKAGTATTADFVQCMATYEARDMSYCVTQVLINLTMLRETEARAGCADLRRARNLAQSFGYIRELEVMDKCERGEDTYVINLP